MYSADMNTSKSLIIALSFGFAITPCYATSIKDQKAATNQKMGIEDR